MKRHAPVLVLLLLLTGCGTSEPLTVRYDRLSNMTTYATRDISLGTMFEGYGIDSGMSIDLRARANCREKSCTPDKIWLTFVASNPRSDIHIMNTDVTMATDTEQYTWSNGGGTTPQQKVQVSGGGLQTHGTYVRGEFVRIALSLSELREIATAESVVEGRVGPESFSLSYEERAPLRKLVDRISS